MDQFNDRYELENARFQTTADEIKPYKNITTKKTFHLNQQLSNDVNHREIEKNLIGHPQTMVLTKHQKKPFDRRTDIALYDTRNEYGLNAQNVLGNHLIETLEKKRIENIVLPHGPETLPLKKKPEEPFVGYDQENANEDALNDSTAPFGFNDSYGNAPITDERLARMKWTKERQFMNESDRVRSAQALRDSEEIKDRNLRQQIANMAGKKQGTAQFGLGRLGSDNIMSKEHSERPIENFTDADHFERYRKNDVDLSLYHEDFVGDVPNVEPQETFTREHFKETYQKILDENKFKDDSQKTLLYDYKYITKRGRHKQSKRKLELNEIADDFLRQYISEYDFLMREHEKEKDVFLRNSQRKFHKNVFENPEDIDVPLHELESLEREKSIRLLKNHDVITEYNDEDVPTVVLDVRTSNGNVPMKLFATKAKEFLTLIQDNNLNFENEIDVVRIPIETLPKKIKEKVRKTKSRSVSLDFDDWNDLLKTSYNGRFEHERVRKEDIMRRLQDSEIQKRIDEGFDDNGLVLTDSRTIQTIEEMKNNAILERKREKSLLEMEKDFAKDEATMTFERPYQKEGFERRTSKIGQRGITRNVGIWNSKW